MIDAAVGELAAVTGTKRACQLLGQPRATHYRRLRPRLARPGPPRRAPANKLTAAERAAVLATLHHESFVDKSVAQVWATLLDEGSYLCSESTMYRILRQAGGVRERRRQATHPPRTRPELVATGPGQVWSWDITKLHGPVKGVYYDLYVIIDIYSRYVPGFLVAPAETGELAREFIAHTIAVAGAAPPRGARRPGHRHDLQTGRAAVGRPRRRPQPQPAQGQQRQPVLRGGVQNVEVLPGVPRPVRLTRRRPRLLPAVLRLLQP